MKTADFEYDVIVVGAGPAGSVAARRLAQTGLSVLLAEQRRAVTDHVSCAEFVPRMFAKHTFLEKTDIAQELKGIQTFICGELKNVLAAPGYVLNRGKWNQRMVEESSKAGAAVMLGARVIQVGRAGVTLTTGFKQQVVKGRLILGCDGPRSLVSRQLGNPFPETCVARQYEMQLAESLDYAQVYFDPAYLGGYAWAFPKGKTVNVGLAVHGSQQQNLHKLLQDFCRQLQDRKILASIARHSTTGGLIPVGGFVNCLATDHLLVAGDAAGCTHPITGAGIMSAVVSGQIAAQTIAEHIAGTAQQPLAVSYTQAMFTQYGSQLAKARHKLLVRDRQWTTDKKIFAELIRRSWITFPEYYEG